MDILVKKVTDQTAIGNEYKYAEMESGKHDVTVGVCRCEGKIQHVTVIVHNASNRAWRGLGKRFDTQAAAVAKYKTPEIREMIKLACSFK